MIVARGLNPGTGPDDPYGAGDGIGCNVCHGSVDARVYDGVLSDDDLTSGVAGLLLALSFSGLREHEAVRAVANAVRRAQLPEGLDLRRAATLLHCTLDGYIINWLHFPERINLVQEAVFLLDTLFGLLANPSPSLLRRP